jgi:hypothetical protein
MDKTRKGEIACILLKREYMNNRFKDAEPDSLKKEIGNAADETGISREELLLFFKEIGAEMFNEINSRLQQITFTKQ